MNLAERLQGAWPGPATAPAVYFPGGTWTHAELWRRVVAAARHLHHQGVSCGDVVALDVRAEPSQWVALLALAWLGVTSFSLPPSASPRRRRELLELVQASWLLVDQAVAEPHPCPVLELDLACAAEPAGAAGLVPADPNPKAPWTIVVGSGSTGRAKLMAISHGQQWARLEAGLQWLPYATGARVRSLVRLDFYAARLRYLEALARGASLVLADVAANADPLGPGGQAPTVLYGTVFHFEQLLQAPPRQRQQACGQLTAVLVGGSSVSGSLRRRICDQLCERLYVLYGANECSTTTCTRLEELHSEPVGVGRPHHGFALEIVAPDGQPVAAGAVGEIRIRSTTTINGYWRDPEATARAFRGGWFYPGDLGRWSPQGQLIHLGRRDDLMIFNGINLYPQELELILREHPAVADAAVVPIRHPVHQDLPAAVVCLRPDQQVAERVLAAHLHERLGVACLQHLWIEPVIPRNGQGKLQRSALNQRVLELLNTSQAGPAAEVQVRSGPDRAGRLTVHWRLPEAPDLAHLERWLVWAFEREAPAPLPVADGPTALASRWLALAGQVALALFEAGRIPLLMAPQLRQLARSRQDPRRWQAVIDLPPLAGLPSQAYELAVHTALRTLAEWHDRPCTGEQRCRCHAHLEATVIPALQGAFPAGKSTLPVLQAAQRLAIPWLHLGGGVFQLGWGVRARCIDRSSTEGDGVMGLKLSHHKAVAAALLRRAGLPPPSHLLVGDLAAAQQAARQLGWPLVLKPADSDRGEGVTVAITAEAELAEALTAALAASESHQALVERQVGGVCHRLFVAHGRLLYAVKRLPLGVVGDGRQAIATLVELAAAKEQARPPWRRAAVPELDGLALAQLAVQGLSPRSVPAAGAFVALRPIETTAWGGVDEDVSERVHPHNAAAALRAAALFGLAVAGIDLISSDISQPWYANGAVINEVNASPQLGGGAISLAQVEPFLQHYLGSSGRIRVEVVVGGLAAWRRGVERWQQLQAEGVAAYLANEQQSWAPGMAPLLVGSELPAGHWHRCESLLLARDAAAIVLVVQSDELLASGLPLDRVAAVHHCDRDLVSWSTAAPLGPERLDQLLALLNTWSA